MSSPRQIHAFYQIASQLRLIERFRDQKYWRTYPAPGRWESVADHSWRLTLLVLLFDGQLSQPWDITKACKMAIIHDLPEILAGDASPLGNSGNGTDSHAYNPDIKADRHKTENAAAKEIFAELDAPQAATLYSLWLETEQNQTFEARLVKALDKIDAMAQVLELQDGHMFAQHLKFTVKYGREGSDVDPAVAAYADYIANELQSRFREFKPGHT